MAQVTLRRSKFEHESSGDSIMVLLSQDEREVVSRLACKNQKRWEKNRQFQSASLLYGAQTASACFYTATLCHLEAGKSVSKQT